MRLLVSRSKDATRGSWHRYQEQEASRNTTPPLVWSTFRKAVGPEVLTSTDGRLDASRLDGAIELGEREGTHRKRLGTYQWARKTLWILMESSQPGLWFASELQGKLEAEGGRSVTNMFLP